VADHRSAGIGRAMLALLEGEARGSASSGSAF
jgi:hypothetical protein